jgi:hypothetical protein
MSRLPIYLIVNECIYVPLDALSCSVEQSNRARQSGWRVCRVLSILPRCGEQRSRLYAPPNGRGEPLLAARQSERQVCQEDHRPCVIERKRKGFNHPCVLRPLAEDSSLTGICLRKLSRKSDAEAPSQDPTCRLPVHASASLYFRDLSLNGLSVNIWFLHMIGRCPQGFVLDRSPGWNILCAIFEQTASTSTSFLSTATTSA